MLPSSTVENYLKAIYHGVSSPEAGDRLLPMGQLATALGVTPGTATTMVKTLAESGLVEYEPYAGVRLSPAGAKLAALVLRRHRLVELFLVQVMGLRWDEVHDEAELLEHVVSERLIDRMDEMLGRPEVDPHGDPIPDAEGIVKAQEAQSLLTCPLHSRVTVTRILDQDKAFLQFVEKHDLKPGESIEVEDRDAASDSVRVRGKDDRRITIGTRAASKLLVQLARVLVLMLITASAARGQSAPSAASSRPWEILDNSFLVEEAFNQDAGAFQNIIGLQRAAYDDWNLSFTQEWPLLGHAHQVSYTLALANAGRGTTVGDALVHYRFQVMDEGRYRPAFAPRISVIVPSGNRARETGGEAGWQVNLPFSKQLRSAYLHVNAGATGISGVTSPQFAIGAIWRARAMLHPMFESVVNWEGNKIDGRIRHDAGVTISPGVRAGWNRGDQQTVLGLALPVIRTGTQTHLGVFGYASYELAFTR